MGIPCRRIKNRSKELLVLEGRFWMRQKPGGKAKFKDRIAASMGIWIGNAPCPNRCIDVGMIPTGKENMTSFYSEGELVQIGFRAYGDNVKISRKSSIYGAEKISIGSNVRIDDFCILSGCIEIGDFIHIAAYTALYSGEGGIVIDDFANLSSRVSIYGISDDYSGETMTNPMVPNEYKNVDSRPVHIGRHVIIGSTSVVLPGVSLGEGSAFGSFSFINKSTESWTLYAGVPIKKIRERQRNLLELEKQMKASCII